MVKNYVWEAKIIFVELKFMKYLSRGVQYFFRGKQKQVSLKIIMYVIYFPKCPYEQPNLRIMPPLGMIYIYIYINLSVYCMGFIVNVGSSICLFVYCVYDHLNREVQVFYLLHISLFCPKFSFISPYCFV